MTRPSRFSPEVRDRAVRMVLEQQDKHDSQWAAITSIAEKFGCSAELVPPCSLRARPSPAYMGQNDLK